MSPPLVGAGARAARGGDGSGGEAGGGGSGSGGAGARSSQLDSIGAAEGRAAVVPAAPVLQAYGTKTILLACAGGGAGIASKTAVAPLERVRILNQTGASKGGVVATLLQVVADDGVRGLWRGNLINCIRVFPNKGVLYMCSDFYREFLLQTLGPTASSAMGGSMAGITASIMTYPLDLIRARQAGVLAKAGKNRSSLAITRRILNNEGFLGMYRGLTPTLVGAVPYEGIKFGVYAAIKASRPAFFETVPDIYWHLACGASAGAAASTIMYPNDTVRRIMQIQGSEAFVMQSARFTRPYSGMIECYVETFRAHGYGRFYRGLGANLIRIVPNTAIQFGTYEYGKKLISELTFS